MRYIIRPLRNGECVIAGHHAFYEGNPDERYPFGPFVWLIEGGGKPKAMVKIREIADIVIPSHDPELLVRFPCGIIGV